MDSTVSPPTHFRIRWSHGGRLGWERFDTTAAAELRARELMHPNESYGIEGFDETCPWCKITAASGR